MSPKILVGNYHPGGTNALIPVINALKQRNHQLNVYSYKYADSLYNSAGIEHKNLDSISLPFLSRILETENPDLLLVGNSPEKDSLEQLLVKAGKFRKIPTISILDFYGIYRERYPEGYEPDCIVVMDNYAREEMIREGFDKEKLIVTGQPAFDKLVRLKMEYKPKLRDKKSVLFVSQALTSERAKKLFLEGGVTVNYVLENLLEVLPKGVTLFLRFHPRQSSDEIEEAEKILARYSNCELDTTPNIYYSILDTDLTSSMFSTTLYEAIFLNRPGLSIQPGISVEEDVLPSNKIGFTVPVYNIEDLETTLEKILFDQYFVEELSERRKQHKLDGKSTERVVNLIEDILK